MKKLVVIGGGFAGSYVAKSLENKFHTTLIDTKNYFEFTPGILRTIVDPTHIKKVQVLHTHYLKRTNIVIGEVKSINKKYVFVKNKKFYFDYLFISSGSSYNSPIKEKGIIIATRANHLRECYESLCKSNDVLIVGGGLVGVELAAEIAHHYKGEKNIFLVHSKNKLMERNPEKVSEYAKKYLEKRNVKILFNEKLISKKGKIYFTDKGTKIKADIAFLCTGIVPNFSFMKGEFSESLNEKNQIIVNEFLQVKGTYNIFSAGDVNSLNIEKTAQNAEHQAKLAVKNIISMKEGRNLIAYNKKQTPLVISLGRHNGIFVGKKIIFKSFIVSLMKYVIEKKEMLKKTKF